MPVKILSGTGLTNKGWKVVSAGLVLGVLGLLFRDIFVLVGAAALGLLLLYEVRVVRGVVGRLRSLVKVKPDTVEVATYAGKPFTCDLEIDMSAGLPLRFESPLKGGIYRFGLKAVKCLRIGRGAAQLRFSSRARRAGLYESEDLRVWVKGRFGLVEGVGSVPFNLRLKIYPRVLATAVAAARFLLEAGGLGVGEQPTPLRGAGLEYADSREYVPGDTFRHMDWKATARLGRLVVKEFYVEGGMGVHLVYEAVAPDPVSLDELSAAFLSSVSAVAEQGLPLGLTVHDGETVLLQVSRVQPSLAVALALQYALQIVKVDAEELYGVLEPKVAKELRRILEGLEETPLREMFEARLRMTKGMTAEPYQVLMQMLSETSGRIQLVYVSSLSRDPLPVLELASAAQLRGYSVLVLQPTKPWVGAQSLEEAYRLYERYLRLNRILENHRIPVAASAEKLTRHVSTVQVLAKYSR